MERLEVWVDDRLVGILEMDASRLVSFRYDEAWIGNGFSISPISLPLEDRVFTPSDCITFEGLSGVFSDSLPDGWGRLITDRYLRMKGYSPTELSSLDRLSIIGRSGRGALEYRPEREIHESMDIIDLDLLARECLRIWSRENSDHLEELFLLSNTVGGAELKIETDDWIIKFPSSLDRADIGKEEYDYSIAARECGLDVLSTRLIESDFCSGYFATERFDRIGGRKIHMVSAGGLLEVSHRVPCLDYNSLMSLTGYITQDVREVEEMFRRMCFNVFAHNRDDHARNFAFLYDSEKSCWKLSPAYDMTYSSSVGGEHATTVNGNGRNPGEGDIMAVGKEAKLNSDWCFETMKDIGNKVDGMLGRYLEK